MKQTGCRCLQAPKVCAPLSPTLNLKKLEFTFYTHNLHILPPTGSPIFGILNLIGSEKHTAFMKLSKIYGTLFSARLGSQLTVVISDYKLIREVFKKKEFTGRPKSPLYQTLQGFGKSLEIFKKTVKKS